jgi:hypothetical protein
MGNTDLSYQSTKSKIWSAYKELLKEIQEKQKDNLENASGEASSEEKQKGGQEAKRQEDFSVEKIIGEISDLKGKTSALLNTLADRLSGEVEKLTHIQQTISDEQKHLEEVYKIRAEADTLFLLIEAQEKQKKDFEKQKAESEDSFNTDVEVKKRKWQQEAEEYEYNRKLQRRKDETDYQFAKEAKERELSEREGLIKNREMDIKELEEKVSGLPQQLEKAVADATQKEQNRLKRNYEQERMLKDREDKSAQQIAQLKISNLEQVIKSQGEHISGMEKQLAVANQKAQDLATKVIEAGKRHEDYYQQKSQQESSSNSTEKSR